MRHLTLILSLAALIGTVASGVLYFLLGDTKQKLNERFQTEQVRSAGLTLEIAETKTINTGLRKNIHSLDAQLATTKRKLTETQVQTDQMQRALDLAEQQATTAEMAATHARSDLLAVQTELASVQKIVAHSISPEDAMRYRNIIAGLEARLIELETALAPESDKNLIVSSRANHAQVVNVGPQNAFVVINFGSSHGAMLNQQLQIKRGTHVLAVVEISATRENYSIAQVLPASLSGKIRKGDAATLTL